MVKSVPPAPDSASFTAARTGLSTNTVPLAVTTITIPTGADNRSGWPAPGPTRNRGLAATVRTKGVGRHHTALAHQSQVV
jgi:hypothetical protein